MRLLLFAALVLLLSACAPLPRYTELDAATWGTRFDDTHACKRAAVDRRIEPAFTSDKDLETLEHNRQMWIKEVKRRGLLTAGEWKLADEKKIQTGMSLCALYASWGAPFRENRTVFPGRVHIQHVYGDRRYVYSDNGKVVSWQTTN